MKKNRGNSRRTIKANEKYTLEEVCQAIKSGRGLVSLSAKVLGCDPKTIRRYIDTYATAKHAQEEAREEMLDIGEGKLFTAVNNGYAWAIKYFLTTQGAQRGYNTHLIIARELAKLKTDDQEYGMEDFLSAMEKLTK